MNEPKPLPSETKLVETPRSDEIWERVWADEFNESLSDTLYDFARQLERELASLADELRLARERVAELEKLLRECWDMSDNWPGIGYSHDLDARIKAAMKEPR